MGVLGTLPGDLRDCLLGRSQEACERVYIGYYLWPRLQRSFEELLQIPPSPLFPGPRPDLPPWTIQELTLLLLAPYFKEDPDPMPIFPPELRLQAMVKFRDGLQKFVEELDKEIEQIKQRSTGQSGRASSAGCTSGM